MERVKRKFLEDRLTVRQWEDIKPIYENLLKRRLLSLSSLRTWLSHWNELESAIEEKKGWNYIHMTRDTTKEIHQKVYIHYLEEIEPHLELMRHQLRVKVLKYPITELLRLKEESFNIWFKCMENKVSCFQEDVSIQKNVQLNARTYRNIASEMTIDLKGEEITLPNALTHLESLDRLHREEVYNKIVTRRLQEKDTFDELYTNIVRDNHKIALNAKFKNFRDYSFVSLNRFDYTVQDCLDFHKSIKEIVVPFLRELTTERQKILGIYPYRPWDHAVDVHGAPPLSPVKETEDLITKSRKALKRTDSHFGYCLRVLDAMDHLDITARKGKAPGAYCYPLAETNVPYIFMNSAATMKDVVTMFHEAGHAVHFLEGHKLEMNVFKRCPPEVSELAAFSTELLTMNHWNVFFNKDEEQLKRAQKRHLINIISLLSWVATIDAFQHWVYTNPMHTSLERKEAWKAIYNDFFDGITNWNGYEEARDYLWQQQHHLFEHPFCYIEYGIAQLGAIAIWKNYQKDPKKGLQSYKDALQLGYTKTIPEIYKTAGISFDFKRNYVEELIEFLQKKIRVL